jgi:molybdopterin/thiamine biosynthesis adenylyltransferase
VEQMNIKIVGLGGIGSILSEKLSRFLNYSSSSICFITLVDGDYYEHKNFERQSFVTCGENKAIVKKGELEGIFNKLIFECFPNFVNNNTIKDVIKEGDTVFLCVDNHKTRKLVSDYCSNLNDIVLISGGNELTDGNIQIFVKKGGEKITPSLTDYHKELENPEDKSPEEMTCEEFYKSEPQLYFTNLMVASYMCAAFYNTINQRYDFSEVYFDLVTMKADSKIRKVKEQKKNFIEASAII